MDLSPIGLASVSWNDMAILDFVAAVARKATTFLYDANKIIDELDWAMTTLRDLANEFALRTGNGEHVVMNRIRAAADEVQQMYLRTPQFPLPAFVPDDDDRASGNVDVDVDYRLRNVLKVVEDIRGTMRFLLSRRDATNSDLVDQANRWLHDTEHQNPGHWPEGTVAAWFEQGHHERMHGMFTESRRAIAVMSTERARFVHHHLLARNIRTNEAAQQINLRTNNALLMMRDLKNLSLRPFNRVLFSMLE